MARLFPWTLIRTTGLPFQTLAPLSADWAAYETPLNEAEAAFEAASAHLQHTFDAVLQQIPDGAERTRVYNARRQFFQKKTLPATFLQNVPPSLTDAVTAWQSTSGAYIAAKTAIRTAYAQVERASFRYLQSQAGLETLRRSLLFASHDLLDNLPHLQQTPVENWHKKERQTAYALLQYLVRAASKTSPFSRLTTLSAERLDSAADGDSPFSAFKSAVTPNVALLTAFYQVLLKEPAFYRSLKVVLNPCIVSADSAGYHWLQFDGTTERFQHSERNPAVTALIGHLINNGRSMPFPTLLAWLAEASDSEEANASAYLFHLIEQGLLEWDLPEKGLRAGWSGNLYQYLGTLPAIPLISETANLLYWLRTAGRSLAYLEIQQAQELLRDTAVQLKTWFEKHGQASLPLQPEFLFYEDVEAGVAHPLPAAVLTKLAEQLADCWLSGAVCTLPALAADMSAFYARHFSLRTSVPFLEFCQAFIREGRPDTSASILAPAHRGLTGGLLQVYTEGNRFRAVVNALYPGGGKMLARWLHLFPAELQEQLEAWAGTGGVKAFPWQGRHNVNFQHRVPGTAVCIPDNRLIQGAPVLLLGNLHIRSKGQGLELVNELTGETVVWTDLGLESPETRPPVVQLLWQAGIPRVSKSCLLSNRPAPTQLQTGVYHQHRVEYGDLVLARAVWQIEAPVWHDLISCEDFDFFSHARTLLGNLGVPRYFYALWGREKPRYFDLNSPMLMHLLHKMLQKAGEMPIIITEMLPTPEQCIVRREGEICAAEWNLEFAI